MNIHFQLIWVNTAWLLHSRKVYLVLWKVLVFHSDCGRCFTFPPGMNENSRSSTSLPAFGVSVFWIMAFLIVGQWYLIVLICISLMRYVVEHLSICWFAIYTSALGRRLLWGGVCSGEASALGRCLLWGGVCSVCLLFNQVDRFLIAEGQEFLCILDNSPFSDALFVDIFSRSVTYLFILVTVSWPQTQEWYQNSEIFVS